MAPKTVVAKVLTGTPSEGAPNAPSLKSSAPRHPRDVISNDHQMLLDLFASAMDQQKAVHEIDNDLGFHKSSRLIDVTDLSRLGRQFLNAALFLAEPEFEDQDKDLKLFMWIMNYQSRNMIHLKTLSREAQKAAVQVQIYDQANPDKDIWMSVQMIGKIIIANGRIVYQVPREIRSQLSDPDQHYYLSMRIAAAFKNQYSLEIYEKLLPYVDEGHSPWKSVGELAIWIGVSGLAYAKDWRYMRRDILLPVQAEINSLSNIFIEIETRTAAGSRRIEAIRFSIRRNPNGKYSPSNRINRLVDENLLDILQVEMGLSEQEISEILNNQQTYTAERIMSAVELVRHRSKEKSIKYPGRYLMTALRDNFKLPSIIKDEQREKEKGEQQREQIKQASQASMDNQIDKSELDWFRSLDKTTSQEIWAGFCVSLPGKNALKFARMAADHPAALETPVVQHAIIAYITQRRRKGDL